MLSSHRAFRCSQCDLNYPTLDAYSKCPMCGTETWEASMQPMSPGEAADMMVELKAGAIKRAVADKNRLAFEEYYEVREIELFWLSLDDWLDSLLC
jgi:hypothetical protein